MSLHRLQNVLHSLAGVRIRVEVRVRFRSEICKVYVRDLEILQRILQVAQIDKLHPTKCA